ncbi:MAG: hypothetical protein U7127_27520 [Phormidium sp.]
MVVNFIRRSHFWRRWKSAIAFEEKMGVRYASGRLRQRIKAENLECDRF